MATTSVHQVGVMGKRVEDALAPTTISLLSMLQMPAAAKDCLECRRAQTALKLLSIAPDRTCGAVQGLLPVQLSVSPPLPTAGC